MEKTTLKIITGADLPPQGWSSRYRRRLDRAVFVAPSTAEWVSARTQPTWGGLYTSSLIYYNGELLGTQWTENNPSHDRGSLLYRVIPKPKAKIAVIDSRQDLFAAIDRWPYHDQSGIGDGVFTPCYTVDWPAASRDVDAIWLTVNGNEENHGPHHREPDLYTWDTETVLWLKPTFLVGRQLRKVTDQRRTEIRAERNERDTTDNRAMILGLLRDPVEGPPAREWVIGLNPVARAALERLVGLDLSPDALDKAVGLPSLL